MTFPERRGMATQVIWHGNDADGFYTSHLVTGSGRHTLHGYFGPPTGRSFVSRGVADCMILENRICREWIVHDNMALASQLGLDPHPIAESMARDLYAKGQTTIDIGENQRLIGQYPPSGKGDLSIAHSDSEAKCLKWLHESYNRSKDGFVQAFNAQAAVDAHAQIIVEHGLMQAQSDQGQLQSMVDGIENNLGRKPVQLSADSGYCSKANLAVLDARKTDGYIVPGRARFPTTDNGKTSGPNRQGMRKEIDDGGYETPYRLRKQMVEPVFGQIKQARGFRQLLLRGVEKVRSEWALVCIAHNLTKLAAAT